MTWNAMLMAMSVAASNPALSAGRQDQEDVSTEDLAGIRAVVRRQIVALRAGDVQTAWDLCSDAIQETFGKPAALLRAVRERYRPLLTATELRFGELHITPAGLGVMCHLTDEDGDERSAVYVVTRGAGGAWAVHGCVMLDGSAEVPALAA